MEAAFLFGLYQVPEIAERIFKHSDSSIRFMPRRLSKCHALFKHSGMVAREIVRVQKEAHPAASLVADGGVLLGTIGFGQ